MKPSDGCSRPTLTARSSYMGGAMIVVIACNTIETRSARVWRTMSLHSPLSQTYRVRNKDAKGEYGEAIVNE